jgi:hypothetical protein
MMPGDNQPSLDLNLSLPLFLIILEFIVLILLLWTGFVILPLLQLFLILMGVFLIYQIGRRLLVRWRIL